ncbi:MAG: sugar ABC transporter ATP-binding protein [Deltaproteobacteria bacterium]|nr:sugar ABC transporter ATP-binding protein [Deltaproteobacteria bacterium]
MAGRVELRGIEKSFGPVAVLKGVTLEIEGGRVHALLGENGAGKSTLMRILLGVESADAGTMLLDGAPYRPKSPAAARAAGVVMVPQERTLCPHLTVMENIVLGIEPAAAGFLRRSRADEAAAKALGLVAPDATRISLDARAGDLKPADQQLVEIARALAQAGDAGRAKVLVLDEPTSSLGHDDAVRLFERVKALEAQGLAIVLVTHFLSDVRAHAGRYTVLRDGKVQGEGDPKVVAGAQIVHEMLGRELQEARGDVEGDARATTAEEQAPEEPVLEVKRLEGAVKPRAATFSVRRGEIFGIAGLVGSGRTELLRAVLGLDAKKSGDVIVRAPKGVGLLSEDRGGEGLMLGRSIADNVTLTSAGPFFVDPRATEAEGAKWIAELSVKASGPEQRVGDLSGGNQQKVQIARLLREDYDVLLVDEPTRGIDVASKAQVLELLRALARKGKGIVLVSSQLDELVATCDRIAVLKKGELGEARPVSEWSEEKLLLEAAS